jgi:hypothetical protein
MQIQNKNHPTGVKGTLDFQLTSAEKGKIGRNNPERRYDRTASTFKVETRL